MFNKLFFWDKNLVAIKTAIAVILTFLVCRYFGANALNTCWAVLTVFVVMDIRLGTTIMISWNRFVGTVIGAVSSMIMLAILPTHYLWAQLLGLLILSIIFAAVFIWKPALKITTGVTIGIIYVIGLGEANSWELSFERLLYILIGIVIPLLVSLLIFPNRASKILPIKIAETFRNTVQLLQLITTNYIDGKMPADETLKHLQSIKLQLREDANLLTDIKSEQWQRSTMLDQFNALIDAQASIFHCLWGLADVANKQNGVEIIKPFIVVLHQSLDKISDFLMRLAQAVQSNSSLPKAVELATVLQVVDEDFAKARHSGFFLSYSNEAVLSCYAFWFELRKIIETLQGIRVLQ